MKISLVSTYPPKKCGIASFAFELSRSLKQQSMEVQIIAINDISNGYNYPDEVAFEIQQHEPTSYEEAANFINLSEADIVCLQHQFGIFGGPEGVFVYRLMREVTKPIITILHTVFKKESGKLEDCTEILSRIIGLSTKVVVIAQKGKDLLIDDFKVPEDKVVVIPHGVPDVPFIDPSYYKGAFNALDKFILLTFGLINPGKGIETVIQTLPQVVNKYPNVMYFVVGATHPDVKRLHGEAYRISLEQMVKRLDIENNVIFFNQFVSDEQLNRFISASDIIITPYLNKQQISSGTLAKAVGSGKAVVSTPYWHAEELLADGRGKLVNFNDVDYLRECLLSLMEQGVVRNQIRKRAYEFSRKMVWSIVATEYIRLFEKAIYDYTPKKIKEFQTYTLPDIHLKYIKQLTDSTCILQHATYGVANRKEGYSTDDAARALVAVLQYYELFKEKEVLNLIHIYLTHLYHAQNEFGLFRNFLSYSREWLDEEGTEDTQGRVIWGLGTMVAKGPDEPAQKLAYRMFRRSLASISELQYIRPIAYAINGLYDIVQSYPHVRLFKKILEQLADRLVERYQEFNLPRWHWYEPILTYGNAKIPEALFMAYEILKKDEYLKVAKESLDFLINIMYRKKRHFFDLIGTEGFYPRNGKRALYGQQPIDAAYLVMACVTAYNITQDKIYSKYAEYAYEWFFGRNRQNKVLYNFNMECCYDGLDEQGVSNNNGAESTICFVLAVLSFRKHTLLIIDKETE